MTSTDSRRPRPPRFPRLWWPLLGIASPVVLPVLALKNRRFTRDRSRARSVNEERIDRAAPLDLPELESLELTVLVEQEKAPGFQGAPGVSYLLTSDRGRLLFDVGFGPEHPSLAHNCRKLGVTLDDVDQLVISHLHPDHMGGMEAMRGKTVAVPGEIGVPHDEPCFLPASASAPGFTARTVDRPRLVGSGMGTTGPLARSMFFMGWTEEQALLANVRGKGLVLVTGCGHPTLEILLRMAGRLSDAPLHALVGGLHLPVTESRSQRAGIQLQMLLGTGKPPWRRIDDGDIDRTISSINQAAPRHVYLSGHDTCAYSIERINRAACSPVDVLEAGQSYRF